MQLAKQLSLRVLSGLLSLLFISFVTFAVQSLASGDAATMLAGEKASHYQVQLLRHQMGLDRPFLVQYGDFLVKAVHGNLGHSYFGAQTPVTQILAQTLPMTMTLAFSAIVLAAMIAIPLGILAALKENTIVDYFSLTFSVLAVTIPSFVLAPIFVYIFALELNYLPQTWDNPLRGPLIYYLIMPVAILAAGPTAVLVRLTRSSVLETMRQEFVRLAIAKGVSPWRLYFKHILRNAILPVITAIGTSFGYLLGGSFIIEQFFRLPGIGHKTIEAMLARDTPVIQGCILAAGALFVFVNLLVDLSVPLLDPRVRGQAL